MNHEIDPATGLPKLPEGMQWEIRENSIRIQEITPPGAWEECPLSWGLCSPYSYDHREVTQERIERDFWGREKRIPARYEHRFKADVALVFWEKFGEWETKWELTYGGLYSGWENVPKEHLVTSDPVTPDNLLERTQQVLTKYLEEQERKEIYGVYPPKKFEGGTK